MVGGIARERRAGEREKKREGGELVYNEFCELADSKQENENYGQ